MSTPEDLLHSHIFCAGGMATTLKSSADAMNEPGRRTHASRVRPTVDHDPPTPSRIATGPPNGSPSAAPLVCTVVCQAAYHHENSPYSPDPAGPSRRSLGCRLPG